MPSRRAAERDRRWPGGARLAVLGTALLASLFTAGIFLAPALDNAGSRWGSALRVVYAPVCHQMPARSLSLGGAPHAVCARCAGLYLGAAAGLLAAALLLTGAGRCPRPLWLGMALAPTALDALLPWIGLPQLPVLPRLVLALPAGAMAALFLAVGVADLFSSALHARTSQSFAHTPALEEADG